MAQTHDHSGRRVAEDCWCLNMDVLVGLLEYGGENNIKLSITYWVTKVSQSSRH